MSIESNKHVHNLIENRENEQYFFTHSTSCKLAKLAVGKTACLFTPTVAEKILAMGDDAIVFDVDERLRRIFKDRFQKYDAIRGLHSKHAGNTDKLTGEWQWRFSTVIIDPPYQAISPDAIAKNANAFLNWDLDRNNCVYVAYLDTGWPSLESAFLKHGMVGQRMMDVEINFVNPPRTIAFGKKQVNLYQFLRV